MRWPTSPDVTAIRQREKTYSRFFLGVQRGKERTSGCLASGEAGTFYAGCHYAINGVAGDTYDNAEHAFQFGNAGAIIDAGIRPGMTLAVGTLTDPFLYGSARIRYVDAANRRILLEPNNIFDEGFFANGDYIFCDGIYRLYRILPYINGGTVNEDGNADNGGAGWGLGDGIAWNANYADRPVALMGSPRFAWTGENVDFYGWRSHGRGGRVITHWTWDFDGGVCAGPGVGYPGSPSSPIHVSWPAAGEYIASLTVKDDSGNAGPDFYGIPFEDHIAVRPVLVYDRPGEGDNPPYTEFEVKSLRGSYGSGWSCSITVFGTADKSQFPDNALVIIFCEDWYAGTQRSMGGWYGQEGILFCGYIRSDSVRVNSETSSVTFEAQTIEQWMKEIGVWPANFASDAGADEWHEFVAMSCEDVLWHLAEIHSTLKNVTDCFFASDIGTQKALGFLDLTESDLYNQMSDQVGSCFFGQLSATRHGSIHLTKHKNMLDLAERTAYGPPIWVFSKQDWRDDLEVGEERMRDSVAQVDFVGFIYDANGNPQDVYSLAPERQTNFGRIEKVTGILLSENTIDLAQPESNTLSGLYRAWKNIRFPHVRVPAKNNRFLEPATQDYFAVILAATDTTRGYSWASKEFITTEVSYEINVEKGYMLVEVTGEASTWGPDGVAGPYPTRLPDLSDDNPPEYCATWPADDPPPWGEPGEGSGDWEPAAGAWVNDGAPGDAWKFFIWQDRLFAVAGVGDGNRGVFERTGPATWTKLDPTGFGGDVYDAIAWNNRIWTTGADDKLYSTSIPLVAGWRLEWTCPGNEKFNIKSPLNSYGGYLYIATHDTVADAIHFHRYRSSWELDFLTSYAPGGAVRPWDFIKYGRFWYSGTNGFKFYGVGWEDYSTNLQNGKFTFCRGMYFLSIGLDKIYRGTGGGWVEDYDPGDTLNWVDLSTENDNMWVGAEIDAATIQVHTKWWGEEWRTILPSQADTWAGGAIRGPDDHVYLGGDDNIWRFVPA